MDDMKLIIKKFDEMLDKNPELKKEWEEDNQFKEDRKQYYLSRGLSEHVATQKSWDDYWTLAKERDGVEFSIKRIEE